ncbi:tectonin beta-propeller repeat-containing protein 2 [Elysia marginata]|uniref:Tectonin beta-propeller repeat-containing protein 2 n=1 Tax=Elysia marginata TaxID=1093978 RepID=A0AAV4HTX4_9GAST|nr:tectonin beta-propeller repeat-containing protein 2 [Elysia marginata]
MVADNCPAHPKVKDLKAIELIFLPHNTTSILQPCDQGTIKSFKQIYRKLMVQSYLLHVEEQIKGRRKDEVYTVNLLDALFRIKEAWSNVKQQCITNCFCHAGFVKEPEEIETIESDIVSVNQDDDSLDTDNYGNLFSRLNDLIPLSATAHAYLAIDDDLAASEVLTTEVIVNSVVEKDVDNEEEGEEDEEEMPPPPPTVADARDAIKTLRLFIQSQSNAEDELKEIKSISSVPAAESDLITVAKTRQKEQSSALSFFKKLGLPLKKQEVQPASEDERKDQSVEDDQSELPPVEEILPTELERLRVFSSQDTDKKFSRNPLDSTLNKKSPVTVANDDIVFSHKVKRHKKKKHKPETSKSKEADIDAISQQSNDSAESSNVNVNLVREDESALKALKEADKMLSVVHDMIKQENNAKSEPLPDVTQQATANANSGVLEEVNRETENTNGFSDQLKKVELSQSIEANVETQETFPYFKEQLKSKIDEQTESNYVSTSVGNVPQDDTESVQENNSCFIKEAQDSSPGDRASLPHQIQINQDSDTTNEHTNSQLFCNASLSEVDQHMKGLMSPSHFEKSVLDVHIQNSSHTVDSALARVTDAKIEEHNKGSSDDIAEDLSRQDKECEGMSKRDIKGRFPLVDQQSFADIYMDLDTIEDMDYFKKNDMPESTTDDFYSEYSDVNPSSQETYNSNAMKSSDESLLPSKFAADTHSQDITKTASHLANSWSEITAPTNIYSLAVSENHVWFTDKSENIYYSSLQASKGIVWRKATGYASQMSVSPSGSIVWRLYKGVVYAGTKISTRHPEGLKWVEAVREVQYIAVANNCAWFIKRSGELMVQQGLSRERPCFRSRQVDCGPYRLKKVTCGGQGVVWCITESLQLLVRTGATCNLPVGDAWEVCVRESPPYLFSHVTIDHENVGWAIDVSGRVWFCLGVTLENPKGTSDWFEVPVSGYVMQDSSMLDMIRAAAKIFDPSKLSYIMSTNRGGLVSAGSQGIWLAMDFRNLLQVCRGTVQGYDWMEAQPARMSSLTMWKNVCASMNHLEHGLVWTQHLKNEIFALGKARGEAYSIESCGDLACISVAPLAVWALRSDGQIFLRTGIGPGCPQGTGWSSLNLSQLGEAHFVHLSCNSSYVWAVEAEGGVYQRIGTRAPSDTDLNPVWLPIDTFGDVCFTKIFVSPLDWMACSVLLLYGTVSSTTMSCCAEASEDDELWGINPDGQLMYCKLKLLPRRQKSTEAFPTAGLTRDMSINEDWEIV